MSDRQISEQTKILLKAREFLSDPNRWCTGLLQNSMGQRCVRGAVWFWDKTPEEIKKDANNWLFEPTMALRESECLLNRVAWEMYPQHASHHIYGHVQVNNTLGYFPTMKMLDRAITLSMEMSKDKVAA